MPQVNCLGVTELKVMTCPRYEVEVDRVTQPEWSELIDRFEDANIYHTWSFGAIRSGRRSLSHLVVKRDGEVRGIAQVRIVCPGKVRLGIAYLRWGPLCQLHGEELDPSIVETMTTALRQEYVANRGLLLEVLPNAFSGSHRAQVFQSALSAFACRSATGARVYHTIVLELSPSLEELRRKLDKKWRNQLSAAERNNLSVIEGDTSEHYRTFCRLYAEMWARKRFHSGVDIEEFGRIQEDLPKSQRMRVMIAQQGGRPVAGLVGSVMGDSAIYLLGATNDLGMKSKGAYLLQWTMIQRLKEKGILHYDLGGIDSQGNPGVYHFKSGLSGVDLTHIGPFLACDNRLSAVAVKAGQVLRSSYRELKHRLAHA